MIGKVIGQFLLATSILRIMPVDAATLEWQAGVTDTAPQVMPVARMFASLPEAGDRATPPTKVDVDSYGIVTNAKSAIVVDAESGATLFMKRPDDVRAIGSITKLMANLVFLESSPTLSEKVELVDNDYIGGGRVYLQFNDPLYLRDVVKASVIGSDNTATNALARFSGKTDEEFVARMNEKAHELGMTSTLFEDPTGILAGNVSTARDLTKLLAAAEANDVLRGIMPIASTTITQESGYVVTVEATDELLTSYLNTDRYQIVAGKTGYIPEAGYCLAAAVQHDEDRIRVVVLGTESSADRFSDVKGLAGWTFKTFSWD